jgi:peptidoglycan-associated lipoprotein
MALALAPFLLTAAGCAHQAPVTHAPAAPVAQAPSPPPAPEKADGQDDEAFIANVLKGAVAHFDFDRDQLKADGQEKLQKVADALREHPKAHVRISGFCDELGTEEYNLALGQRRAEVARKYLVALGVSPGQVDTVSFGKEKPADPAHNEDAWAANRRDEVEPK